MKKLTADWFKAALIRAIRTFAQTLLSLVTVGAAFDEVNWTNVLSVSGVAAILSICTSIVTGLPEASKDGVLIVDDSNTDKDVYTLEINGDPSGWANKDHISLAVEHKNDKN